MSRKPTSSRHLIVAMMVLGVIGSACGARVSGSVRQQAANSVLKVGSSGQGVTPGDQNPGAVQSQAPGQTTSTAPTGPQPGSTGVPGHPGTQPSSGTHTTSTGHSTGPSNPQASTCRGTGTDVGLTASTLTLGTIATLTGPVSGLFEGAVQGSQAFGQYINNAGGLCGHSVSFTVGDDGTNCSQNQNATDSLIHKTFALVGSFSLYDGCGADIIRKNPTVPDVHLALDDTAKTPSNHIDISSGELGYATGMFHYYAQKYGSKVQHVGSIIENIPSAISNQQNMEHAAESQGWKFVNDIKEAPTASDFTQDFQKLCGQSHIQVFFLLTEPAANAATMMHNERDAGCKGVINIVPIAYDQAFLEDYGSGVSALNGLQGWSEYALFYNKDEAARIPEVKLFQQWFQRSYPGKPVNLYAMYAWADARLFQQAFENAGKVISRQTVLTALRKIKNFSANGLIAPRDFSQKAGVHCYITWQLQNGAFQRIDDPKSGFRCDGKFLPRS